MKILDFGSADGKTMFEINKLLPNSYIQGIEYSEKLIETAKNLPENLHVVQGDICNVARETSNNSFDVVTALACLEHLAMPLEAIKEAFRVLEPNGLFIATCPSPFWDRIASKAGLLKEDEHAVALDKKRLISTIKQVGFQFVEYKRFMGLPVAFFPYFKMPVSVQFSLAFDHSLECIKIFPWLYVNQMIIGRKSLNPFSS